MVTESRPRPNTNSLLRSSGKTSLLLGLGVAARMTADVYIAGKYGLGSQTDAFFVACTAPMILEALIYPACQSGLVPIVIRAERSGGRARQWALLSTLLNLGLLLSAGLTIAGLIGAPWLASVLAPGTDPDSRQLIARLTRIFFASTLFVGPIGVMRAFLNAHQRFAAPAALDLVRGTAILAAIAIDPSTKGIKAAAVGYAAGGCAQFALLAAATIRQAGLGYRPIVKMELLRASQAARLFGVRFVDYVLIQAIILVERIVGSYLPSGSISIISYGHRLASASGSLLFSGVEVVSLSALASDFAQGSRTHVERARQTLAATLRWVCLVGIPAASAAWFLRVPIVQLLFERGAFTQQTTSAVAPVLGLYCLSIPFYGYWLLLKNYYFAALRPTRILTLSALGAAVNVALALLLPAHIGTRGVALGFVAGFVVPCVLGSWLSSQEWSQSNRGLGLLAFQVSVSSLVIGWLGATVCRTLEQTLVQAGLSSTLALVLSLPAAGLLSCVLLALAAMLLGIKETEAVRACLLKRSRRHLHVVKE